MQLIDGTIIVSASDLVGYLACDHLASLELGRIQGRWEKPHHRTDPELDLLREKGDAHEKAYLERHRAAGRTIYEVVNRDAHTPAELRAAEAETLDAMRRGVEVIYQATFFDGRWRGHADFLLRVERPSLLGGWSYDVADTKLARGVKAGAILQVCVYADRLETLQGVPPERLVIVTGDNVEHEERLSDYARVLPHREGGATRPSSSATSTGRHPRRIPIRSTTAGCAPGSRLAWTGAGPTITFRSWPG